MYGNRATQNNGDGLRTYTYDAAHQLLTIEDGASTDMGYEYDDNGNLTRQLAGGVLPILTLNYDALDRLNSAELDDGSLETYQYDPGGRRIEKRQGAATEQFIYSGANLVADYGGTWTQAAGRYTHAGIDNPLIHTGANGASQFYQQDGLGSVVAMTDAAGTLLGAHQYDAWGTVVTRSGHLQRFGYTGREADATGLLYYRARYYDPSTGRFTQRDPLGFVDGVNQYAYAANNPVMFVDPFGTVATGSIHNNSTAQRTSYEKRPSFWDRVSSAAPQLLSAAAGTTGIPYAESKGLALYGRHEQAAQAAIEETALRLGGAAVGAGIGALGLGVGAAPGALIGQQVAKMANSARGLYGIVRGIFKGTCSFPAGTPVLTEQGPVPIESLQRGDLVFSRHETTGETAYQAVTGVGAREHASQISLGIAHDGGMETLVTTAEHPFYVGGQGFIRADSVSAGMQLVTATGESLDVVAARTRESAFLAYDISVDKFHTYFVGERGVWVHNCASKGVAKEIGILRDAAKGKGNFGLGTGTRTEADKLGKAWVGDDYKIASDGKTLVGKDGLRQYRPPSYKGKLGKTQANFEQKIPGQKTKGWQSNSHLDVIG